MSGEPCARSEPNKLPGFVVFSDDWGEHPSSAQHLFREVAREHSVLWVNTIGMRSPRLTLGDLRKASRKLSRMCFARSANPPVDDRACGVKVCQPFMLPFGRMQMARDFNARSVRRAVLHALGPSGLSDRVIVTTVPNAGDYGELFGQALVVYYCVDDFSEWPGLDAELVREMEKRLIERADLLIAASPKLSDHLAAFGKRPILLTHGVDVELFARQAPEHPRLAGLSKPRAGFFGLIDQRLDEPLIAEVAAEMPDFSFVLAGPVESQPKMLRARPNVHFTGPIPYRELPSLIAALDVLVIPYSVGDLAEKLSPLKLKEYLITGKPIVSTPFAEARRVGPYVTTAATADDWIRELRSALAESPEERRRAIRSVMEGESWASKARSLLSLCTEAAEALTEGRTPPTLQCRREPSEAHPAGKRVAG